MSKLVFVMGCTGAGKSTFLDALKEKHPNKHGYVEVGKALRAKYPPEYFVGQAAPEHTQKEAWDLCVDAVANQKDKEYIFVDGQPRSVHQLNAMFNDPDLKYSKMDIILLDSPVDVRQKRLQDKYKNDPKSLDLAMLRVKNDMVSYHPVLLGLIKRNISIEIIDTNEQGWLENLLSKYN